MEHGEVYEFHTMEELLHFYTEAQEAGAKPLTDEIWKNICDLNHRKNDEQLVKVRERLNNAIEHTKCQKD